MIILLKNISKTFSWWLVFLLLVITSLIMYTPFRQVMVPEYHLLHTFLEAGCVLVSMMIFIVIIVLRNLNRTNIFQIFGIPFLFIGLLDILHSLAVIGIPSSILVTSRQESISFWLAARILETLAFAAFLSYQNFKDKLKFKKVFYSILFLFATISIWIIYFQREILPGFTDAQGNLTPLKVVFEILIMLQHILFAGILIRRQLNSLPDRRLSLLTTATLIFTVAGLCFSVYGLGYNLELFWGHVLKVIAYFYIFKAVLQSELVSPYLQLSDLNTLVLKQTDSIRELQNQMLAAERLGTIGLGVGSVVHDLNNMLQVVDISTKKILQLTSNLDKSDPIHQHSEHIVKSLSKTREFQRLLLSRTKGKDFGVAKALYPHQVTKEFLPLAQTLLSKSMQIDFVGDENCVINCSQAEFEQLLLNLLVNARDAVPDQHGRIHVKLTATSLTSAQIAQNGEIPPGQFVILSVRDSGIGIAPEVLEKIFLPAYSNKKSENGGFGLGLFTVMEIAKRWNGYIQVDSQVEQGTEFRIWFPCFQKDK